MAEIPGLYNTGEGFSENAQDTHYALSCVSNCPGGLPSYGYVAGDGEVPVGYDWVSNTSTSRWLSPYQAANTSLNESAAGIYRWRLSFDLTGYDPSTASIDGKIAVDNKATIKINGTTKYTDIGEYQSWTDFSITSGFVAGTNTLDFEVYNGPPTAPNPTGLQVQFTSSVVNEQGAINAHIFNFSGGLA